MTNQQEDATGRPVMGQPSEGIAAGEEQRFTQGFPVGSVMYRFGSRVSVTRDLPGWFVADGTQPPFTLDGVNYGSPNLTKKVIMGADATAGFNPGDTGGTDAHFHPFTHESAHAITQPAAHVITQPVFDAPAAHAITQPVVNNHAALATHQHALPFAKDNSGAGTFYLTAPTQFGTVGLGVNSQSTIALTNSSIGPLNQELSQAVSGGTPDAHTLSTNVGLSNNHSAPNRSTDVALTHNHDGVALSNNAPHAGGSVDAATGANKYPPYVAVWPLIKVYG